MKVVTYIGTYTDATQTGIHILETDTETGAIRPVGEVRGMVNATYLARSKKRPVLYAVQGVPTLGPPAARAGFVAAYRISGTTLTPLNHKPVTATVPCHISLDADETALAFAEYAHAVSGYCDLNSDGSFADTPPVTVTHAGNGPDVIRQDKAHAHCVRITPDGQFLCIADLGLDRVLAYDWSRRRDGLSPVAALTITAAPGAGPRHLIFHPNGRFAFLLNEINNTLTSLRYTGDAFIPLHTRSTLPADFHAFSKASALKCSADGRRLLASNRGHDSIAAFDVDPDSGRLDLLAISTLAGTGPRDFAFTPGEAFILAGHETSNTVCSYAYDAASGRLEPACAPHPIHRPVCIVFGQPVIEPALTPRPVPV
jgi:6-phosphogluconolactonase